MTQASASATPAGSFAAGSGRLGWERRLYATGTVRKPRLARLTATGWVVALFAAWSCASLGYICLRWILSGDVPIGPGGVLAPVDQLRYLAWIRDAGNHVLIGNPFDPAHSSHVYLHPLFALAGAAWRLGLSLPLAFLGWLPVAIAVMAVGYFAYVRRLIEPGGARAAALAIALLYMTPLLPALDYSGTLNANGVNAVVVVAGHTAGYWQTWGYFPTAIALGLMPLFLLGLEAILVPARRRRGWGLRLCVWLTAGAGLFVSWLHPWGGLVLIVITAGLIVWRRMGSDLRLLALPLVATGVPLIYYALLAASDPTWGLSNLRTNFEVSSAWPLVAAVAPLAVPALAAGRPAVDDLQERIVRLWPLATLVVFATLSRSAQLTTIEGLSLPLAVLAVRGFQRVHPPRAIAALAVLALTVPGMLYSAHTLRDVVRSRSVPYQLTAGERLALAFVGSRKPGTLLATSYLASALPAFAGRAASAGPAGTSIKGLFNGSLTPAAARALVRASGATTLVSDCHAPRADLEPAIASLGFRARRFGCAVVYVNDVPAVRPG
jgi:hypothetical protein